MAKEARKRRAKPKTIPIICPFAFAYQKMMEARAKDTPFWRHLTNARIEVLEAFKSLLEERIEHLREEKGEELSKIEVE